ncbi:MAG TPA: zinc ribbon domain-containing protein [Thermoleophilaceae bacterium]|nr:zinc ribbon domain-containing protein [Thermoleophilaceae bacterium]
MGPLAVFGITNDGLNLAVNLLLLFLVVMYFALVWWTYSDAQRRIEDPMIVACATAASLFPFVGTVVYLIVRPPEYLEDVRERELEIAAAEARLAGVEHQTCPYCNYEIEKSFLVCPSCMHRLKEPCTTCGKPLDPRWKVCPYCEAEVGAPAQQQPRRERRPRRERPAAATGESPTQVAGAEPPPRRATKQRPPREDGQAQPRREREAAPQQRQSRPAAEGPADGQQPQRERPTRPARS